MSARLSPQREAEIVARAEAATPGPWRRSEDYNDIHSSEGDHLASYWHTADGAFIAHAPEDINALAAELAAVRAERDELKARSQRLIEQWNERAETWAPLSSPEKNPESFERYRALCSAYCEAADNLHNVLNGFDPDVPWHLRDEEATS